MFSMTVSEKTTKKKERKVNVLSHLKWQLLTGKKSQEKNMKKNVFSIWFSSQTGQTITDQTPSIYLPASIHCICLSVCLCVCLYFQYFIKHFAPHVTHVWQSPQFYKTFDSWKNKNKKEKKIPWKSMITMGFKFYTQSLPCSYHMYKQREQKPYNS